MCTEEVKLDSCGMWMDFEETVHFMNHCEYREHGGKGLFQCATLLNTFHESEKLKETLLKKEWKRHYFAIAGPRC